MPACEPVPQATSPLILVSLRNLFCLRLTRSGSHIFKSSSCSLILATLGCSEPHPNRIGTTTTVLSKLKFYSLPLAKGIKVHPLKVVAVKEYVFFLLCLDKAIAVH